MDAKEYDSDSTISNGFVSHLGIPKTEMDNEDSDTGSYTSSSSMDDKEMKNNSNDFYSKHYLSDEEYDIENHPMCFCGRLAKQRISFTAKNPGRPFFNCAKKNFNTQCGFFQWCDELYEDCDGDENDDEDEEELDSNYLEHDDEKMVLSEVKSTLTYQVPKISVQVDQLKEMNFFPQYPDLALLVQDHKPQVGLDGSILSLAPPGLPPV